MIQKTILVDAYMGIVRPDIGLDVLMYDLLQMFSNPKIIVTNADTKKQQELGLTNLPYPLFTQHFSPLKTESQYFYNLFSEYDLQSSQVIYFEHDLKAVNTASSLGIVSYHYDYEKRDLVALEKFLQDNI